MHTLSNSARASAGAFREQLNLEPCLNECDDSATPGRAGLGVATVNEHRAGKSRRRTNKGNPSNLVLSQSGACRVRRQNQGIESRAVVAQHHRTSLGGGDAE